MHPTRFLLLLAAALSAVLTAPRATLAGSNVVARADFNADTVGEPPDTSLPGDPEGDSMLLAGSNWITVVESSGPLTDQPMEFDRTSGTGSPKAYLYWNESAYSCNTWTIRWCAVARTVIPPIFFVLRGDIVRDGRAAESGTRIFATMNTRGSNINILTDSGEVTVASWTIDQPDCFEWTIDLLAETTSLVIDGATVAEDLPINTSADFDVTYFGFESSTQISFTYAMDDIEILAGECPTPVEPTTWGRLKATYR
jgi:hypothetical protein